MTLEEIRVETGRLLQQITPDSSSMPAQADIDSWANLAVMDLAINLVDEALWTLTDSTWQADTNGATKTFPLPSNMLRFLNASIQYTSSSDGAYYSAPLKSFKEFEYACSFDQTHVNSPFFSKTSPITTIRDNKLHYAPLDSTTVWSYLYYMREPYEWTGGTDNDATKESDLPKFLHKFIPEYCVIKAQEQDEKWQVAQGLEQVYNLKIQLINQRYSRLHKIGR